MPGTLDTVRVSFPLQRSKFPGSLTQKIDFTVLHSFRSSCALAPEARQHIKGGSMCVQLLASWPAGWEWGSKEEKEGEADIPKFTSRSYHQ